METNNNLAVFTNPDFGEVRTLVKEDGSVLFCGKDVAQALGYSNVRDAVAKHCRWALKQGVPHPQSPDKTIDMAFIPESDVYRLAFGSKLDSATIRPLLSFSMNISVKSKRAKFGLGRKGASRNTTYLQ